VLRPPVVVVRKSVWITWHVDGRHGSSGCGSDLT